MAGAVLGEPRSAYFVAGAVLCEPRSADFVASVLTLTLTLIHSHTLTLTLTLHSHSRSHSHSLPLAITLTHSLHSLTPLTHSLTHSTHSLHSLTHSLTHTHTHTHTHSHPHSLSLTLALTHTRSHSQATTGSALWKVVLITMNAEKLPNHFYTNGLFSRDFVRDYPVTYDTWLRAWHGPLETDFPVNSLHSHPCDVWMKGRWRHRQEAALAKLCDAA